MQSNSLVSKDFNICYLSLDIQRLDISLKAWNSNGGWHFYLE